MSRSPRTLENGDSLAEYRAAWQATTKLIREGRSFSGHERNCAFLNCEGKKFANVSSITGLDFADDGRAIGVTDWDHDGDLDLWLYNRTGPRLRLMRNQTIGKETEESPTANANSQALRANYISLCLQGTKSNRDAIGSRVELITADESSDKNLRTVQTLCAGDAFLSQSSKWMHFGLGDQSSVEKILVRWPNGSVESFPGSVTGRRYRLIEGTGTLQAVPSRMAALALTHAEQSESRIPVVRRSFLSNRIPLPILKYESLENNGMQIATSSGRTQLLVLWASWCPLCREELKHLASLANELKGAGIDVLALSVDGLDVQHTSSSSDAKRFLKEIKFPFAAGFATRTILDKLELSQSFVFNRVPTLAVPTSFLLDAKQMISAIYVGDVSIDTLKSDVAQLNSSAEQRRDLAVPFAGRWISPPKQILLRAVAFQFKQQGHEDDYLRYLKLDVDEMQRQWQRGSSVVARAEIQTPLAAAYYNLGLSELATNPQAAFKYFQQAIQVDPNHAEATINLGSIYAKAGRLDEAIRLLERAVELVPDSLPARMNLAAALGSSKNYSVASEHYRIAIEKHPDHAVAHLRLARILLELQEFEAAASQFQTAIQLDPNDVASTLGLAWLEATCPNDSLRNGSVAVNRVEALDRKMKGKNLLVLDVLSAAYAEQGEFEKAKETIQKSLQQLSNRQPALQSAMQKRLAAYEVSRPIRDPDGKYP